MAAPPGLIQRESGGRFDAQNDVMGHGGKRGHFGRAQFGQARLEDAKRAGVIPPTMTPAQFLADPEAQMAVETWHFGDIRRHITAKGYDRRGYDVDGLVRVAHLGGIGGMDRYVQTRGAYDPADAFGTRLSDYYGLTGGQQGGQAQAAPQGGGMAAPAAQPGMMQPPAAPDPMFPLNRLQTAMNDPAAFAVQQPVNRLARIT